MPWTTRPNMVRIMTYPDPVFPSVPYMQGMLPTYVQRQTTSPSSRFATLYNATSTSLNYYDASYVYQASGFNACSDLTWPSSTYATWQQYTGAFTSNDDGYTSSTIPIGFTWYMGGTGYTSFYVGTNGYIIFNTNGANGIYSGTSVPAAPAIMCHTADQWLQPGLVNLTGNIQDIFYRTLSFVLDGVTHYIFQLMVFAGRYGNTSNDNSYILNLFSQGSQQLIETGIRPEAAFTGNANIGPVVPGSTITRAQGERGNTLVWESQNNGTNWSYLGRGCVVPGQKVSTSSGSGGSGISIRTALHDTLFPFYVITPTTANNSATSITTRGYTTNMYYGSGLSNSTNFGWGINNYYNNGTPPYVPIRLDNSLFSSICQRAYLGSADTSNGFQTYVKSSVDTITAAGQPGYNYNYFNTTNSGSFANSVSLSDVLNWLRTSLRRTWTSGGQTQDYWENRITLWANTVVLPAVKSGAIANGYSWVYDYSLICDPRNSGVKLSQLADGSQQAINLQAGQAPSVSEVAQLKPVLGTHADYKIPSTLALNYGVTRVYKKWDNIIYGGTNQILYTALANNSIVKVSDMKDFYHTGLVYVASNTSQSGFSYSKTLGASYSYASSSYRPYVNSTIAAATSGISAGITNLDGTANTGTWYANLVNFANTNMTAGVGVQLIPSGRVSAYATYGGGGTYNNSFAPSYIALNHNTFSDAYAATNYSVSFSGTITVGANHNCFVLDPDAPFTTTTTTTTSYFSCGHRFVPIVCISSNTPHLYGDGNLNRSSNVYASAGTSSSIVGTLTFRNNLSGATATAPVDIRLSIA